MKNFFLFAVMTCVLAEKLCVCEKELYFPGEGATTQERMCGERIEGTDVFIRDDNTCFKRWFGVVGSSDDYGVYHIYPVPSVNLTFNAFFAWREPPVDVFYRYGSASKRTTTREADVRCAETGFCGLGYWINEVPDVLDLLSDHMKKIVDIRNALAEIAEQSFWTRDVAKQTKLKEELVKAMEELIEYREFVREADKLAEFESKNKCQIIMTTNVDCPSIATKKRSAASHDWYRDVYRNAFGLERMPLDEIQPEKERRIAEAKATLNGLELLEAIGNIEIDIHNRALKLQCQAVFGLRQHDLCHRITN